MEQLINWKAPICLCEKCREAMAESYEFEVTGRRGKYMCMNHPWTAGTEYFFWPKNMRRYKPRQEGPRPKDRRARYRGDWRDS